ncbi:MAG: rhodanese-like domain-containing protein [Methylococcaceae bacterium]
MKHKTIFTNEALELITSKDPMILDCRDVAAYKAGHINNALHMHDGLQQSLVKRGDKQRALLIYCYHGHASEHVAEFFTDFGFQDVYSLAGGYADWQKQQQDATA